MKERRKMAKGKKTEVVIVDVYATLFGTLREVVGPWSDEELRAVLEKVESKTRDGVLDAVASVFEWCSRAQRSGDAEAVATVDLWKTPGLPIIVSVDDEGGVVHRLDPRCKVTVIEEDGTVRPPR